MTAPQRFRLWAASGPVKELDCMYDRDWATGDKLGDAADVAGCDQIGLGSGYIGQLAIPQRGSDLRL